MRASRLLAILILLQLRVRLTAQALADEFEVSVRTIYRDVDALSAAGVPVYADRGPGGGFQLLDGWRTNLTGLAGDEAEAMALIGLPGPAAALGLDAAAKRAGGKMLAALPMAQADSAGRLSARFHLDPLDWYREEEPAAHLPALVRAVLDQQVIDIGYESWTARKDHRLDPLGLVMKGGGWYLVARGKRGLGTYKVANIVTLDVTDVRFERPPDFDLARCWREQLAGFAECLRPLTAELRVTAEGARRLAEEGDFAAAAVSAGHDGPNGRAILLPVESVDQAAALVLGLAGEAVALAPLALRGRIAALATAAAVQHES